MTTEIRWSRVGLFVGVLAALTLVGGLSPLALSAYREYRANAIDPQRATSEEFRAILQAVLVERVYEGVPPPPPPPPRPGEQRDSETRAEAADPARRTMLLVDHTLALCDSQDRSPRGSCDSDRLFFGPELDSGPMPLRLRRELLAANATRNPVPRIDSKWVRLISDEDLSAALAAPGWWRAFYTTYPESAGYAEVTWPVLSVDHNLALIYVSHSCDGTCGTGYLHLLERRSDAWVIVSSMMLWIS